MANIYHFYEAGRNRNNNSRRNRNNYSQAYYQEREDVKIHPTQFELIKYSEGQTQYLNPFEGKEIKDEDQLEIVYWIKEQIVARQNIRHDEIIISTLQFNIKYEIDKLVFAKK